MCRPDNFEILGVLITKLPFFNLDPMNVKISVLRFHDDVHDDFLEKEGSI